MRLIGGAQQKKKLYSSLLGGEVTMKGRPKTMVTRGLFTTRVSELIVVLKRDYRSPEDHTPQVFLSTGTKIKVYWISGRGGKNYHDVQFMTIDSISCVEVTWDDVEHPKHCMLIQPGLRYWGCEDGFGEHGIYGQGRPMDAIYCATHNDFIGITTGREDIANCPICGRNI